MSLRLITARCIGQAAPLRYQSRRLTTREVLSRVAEVADNYGWQRSAQFLQSRVLTKEDSEGSSHEHVNEWRETEILGAHAQKEVPEIILPSSAISTESAGGVTESGITPTVEMLSASSTIEVVSDAAGKALGSWPSDYALWTINAIHTEFDVPFWIAIAGTTFAIRTALAPISVLTMKHAARMQKAKPEIDLIQNRMKQDDSKDTSKLAMYQQQMAAVLEKHQVRPYLIFLFPLCQLPIFTSMFFGLQRLGVHYPDASHGGALWFTDLTVADPYYILPIATSSIFFLMVESGSDGMSAAQGQAATFRNIMRVMAFAMIPLTAHFPSSVFTYWFTANCFSVLQTGLLNKNQALRKALDLPPKPKVTSTKRVDAVTELSEAFSEVRKTVNTIIERSENKQQITPVDAAVFQKRKQDNAWLARNEELVQPVQTLKQKPNTTATDNHVSSSSASEPSATSAATTRRKRGGGGNKRKKSTKKK